MTKQRFKQSDIVDTVCTSYCDNNRCCMNSCHDDGTAKFKENFKEYCTTHVQPKEIHALLRPQAVSKC
jgi:hypothetical protein